MSNQSSAPYPQSRIVLSRLERGCGLPEGFLGLLQAEANDWAFIIKMHAFIETALTDSLLLEMNRPELDRMIQRFNLGGATGKVKMALALKICSKRDEGAINLLTKLRNKCVHQIRNLSFDIEKFVQQLDLKDLREFKKAVGLSDEYRLHVGKTSLTSDDLVKKHTRIILLRAARSVLVNLATHQISVGEARAIKSLAETVFRAEADARINSFLKRSSKKGKSDTIPE